MKQSTKVNRYMKSIAMIIKIGEGINRKYKKGGTNISEVQTFL